MKKLKINSAEQAEMLKPIKLTLADFPIAYNNKVEELIEECGMSEEEAHQCLKDIEFNLEIYYQQGAGLFAVECEAVESGGVYSPYTGDLMEECDED